LGAGHLDSKALAAAHHRVNLSIVDKMMKERFKEMRAREEAEELSRRKIQQDNLIRKQLQKKAEQQQNSQRLIKDGMAKRLGLKQYKQQQ
jgi:lysozyme family protein